MADNHPIFVISDLHMGDGGARDNFPLDNREKELGLFLDYVASRRGELIVLGDLFEFWQMNLSKIVMKHMPLLDRLAAMNATYVVGNHDADLDDFIGTGFLSIPCSSECAAHSRGRSAASGSSSCTGTKSIRSTRATSRERAESFASWRGMFEDGNKSPVYPNGDYVEDDLERDRRRSLGAVDCAGEQDRPASSTWADWEWQPSILPLPKTLIGPRKCSTSTGRIRRPTATTS